MNLSGVSEFLKSLRADLLDRRLLPLVAVVVLALVGAIGYAALGGGSTTATSSPPPVRLTAVAPGIAVSATQPTAVTAVAETTAGAAAQRKGPAHDPFIPLPGGPKPSTTGTRVAAVPGKEAAKATGTGTGAGGAGAEVKKTAEPAPPVAVTPPAPPKPKTVYKVALQFGLLPAGVAPANAELPSYTDLVGAKALPSKQNQVIRFLGARIAHGANSAVFALGGEVILHGQGTCLPSAAQCQVLEVPLGKTEQLEVFSAGGQLVTYELRVLGISAGTVSAARVSRVLRAEAQAGRQLLARDGALRLAGMHFGGPAGVLVFDAPSARAKGARHSG